MNESEIEPYIIVSSGTTLGLESNVADHMRKGYAPIGGVATTAYETKREGYTEEESSFYQAMILK